MSVADLSTTTGHQEAWITGRNSRKLLRIPKDPSSTWRFKKSWIRVVVHGSWWTRSTNESKRHSLHSRTQQMYTRGVSNDSFSKINMCFCVFDIFVMCFLLVNNFYFSFMALYLWWKNVPLYEWMFRCFKLIKNLFLSQPCAHFSSIEDNASFKFGGENKSFIH